MISTLGQSVSLEYNPSAFGLLIRSFSLSYKIGLAQLFRSTANWLLSIIALQRMAGQERKFSDR